MPISFEMKKLNLFLVLILVSTLQFRCVQTPQREAVQTTATTEVVEQSSDNENASRGPASINRKPNADNGISVVPMQTGLDLREMKKTGYEVYDPAAARAAQAAEEPEPAERDALFLEAGAWPFVMKLDQLDRDLLYLRAREYTAANLAKTYPKIPASVRSKLQTLLRGEKGRA